MRNSWSLFGLFNALLLFIWLPKNSADPDQLKAPSSIRAAYGESLTVPCWYDPKFRDYTKYWCRGAIYKLCKIVVKTPKQRYHERWSITDDKEAGKFIVTMTSLERSDEDMYWCVIARHGKNVFSGVKLIVSEKVPDESSETKISRWWEPLRWIIFLSLVLTLVLARVVVWRSKATQKIFHTNVSQRSTNIYG
ncbi:CMRF35-like molecule 3 [Corythoichthys intestinalis]|uniref:CMRF35-like molecule 3 n=1 Tax=Corythoichthys intestinalis TaxID=161448 RepID=UPI0025A5CC7E|nr:CMRF35-like molecule 3 [Corythoichthys intestinalis]